MRACSTDHNDSRRTARGLEHRPASSGRARITVEQDLERALPRSAVCSEQPQHVRTARRQPRREWRVLTAVDVDAARLRAPQLDGPLRGYNVDRFGLRRSPIAGR